MGGYYFTNQAIQWWNMVSACNDFSGASNVVNCVWGGVSTAITASGVIYSTYVGAGHIANWMNNNAITFGFYKRQPVPQGLLDELSTVFRTPVSHAGIWNRDIAWGNGTLNKRNSGSPVDVFAFTSNGIDHHFTYLGNSTTHGHVFRLGYAPKPSNSTLRARTQWDSQYFTNGGIDFSLTQNPDDYVYATGATLDTNTDYGWIYDQVACTMNSQMSATGHSFQLYDNVHKGTLSGGLVAPYLDSGPSAISLMAPEGGLVPDPSCSGS
jgi:hypothetical protein